MSTQTRQKKTVEFKTEKSFGELIGMPFAFLFQEFKPYSLAVLKYGGPFIGLAILTSALLRPSTNDLLRFSSEPTMSFFGYIFIAYFIFGLGILAITTVTYVYASLYEKHGKGNFTINDIGSLLKRFVFKVFAGGFLMGLMMIPMIFLAIIPILGPILFYVAFFYLYTSLSFFAAIIVHEDAGVGEAFSRSFEIIKGKWWNTFGLYLVFGLILGVSSLIFIIPLYIYMFASVFSGAAFGTGAIVLTILFSIILLVAYIFFISLQQLIVSFQYFNLRVRKEGVGLVDRISEINDVSENEKDDAFEVKDEQKETEKFSQEKEEKPKTEDGWSKLLDENQKKNRFEDSGDENDRFKPKY